MKFTLLSLALSLLLITACSNNRASHPTGIKVVRNLDPNACAWLGSVEGGAKPGLTRRKGLKAATDEAIYQAEILTATHLTIDTHDHSEQGTHVTGQAFRC